MPVQTKRRPYSWRGHFLHGAAIDACYDEPSFDPVILGIAVAGAGVIAKQLRPAVVDRGCLTTRQARVGLGARLSAVTEKRATGSPGTNGIVGPLRRVVQILLARIHATIPPPWNGGCRNGNPVARHFGRGTNPGSLYRTERRGEAPTGAGATGRRQATRGRPKWSRNVVPS
jgi:hypothetical protein